MGVLWSLIHQGFLLGLYTLAFGVILKARWGTSGNTGEYALVLFLGMVVLNSLTEVINKSSAVILDNPNLVKRVVFPLELLSVVTVATAFIHALIGLSVWMVVFIIFFGFPGINAIYSPLVFVCLAPLLLGFAWLFSAVGVFFKDVRNIAEMLSHVLLFLSPVFYSIDSAPAIVRSALLVNPITFLIEQLRSTLFSGHRPSFEGLAIYFLVALLFAAVCFLFFRRLQPNFADMV